MRTWRAVLGGALLVAAAASFVPSVLMARTSLESVPGLALQLATAVAGVALLRVQEHRGDAWWSFVGADEVRPTAGTLTSREVEVLRLVAHGCSNDEIGTRLSLSTRTVERHLSSTYAKLGLSGRSARAAAAAQLAELERALPR